MSGKSYQTNAQQSSQLFVKIEEFFDKERAPFYRRKKEEKAGNGSKWGTNRDFGQAARERERTGKIL